MKKRKKYTKKKSRIHNNLREESMGKDSNGEIENQRRNKMKREDERENNCLGSPLETFRH